jgi:hypothetical protein
MKRSSIAVALVIGVLGVGVSASAQNAVRQSSELVPVSDQCIRVADVTKWEVIDSSKVLAYSGSTYLAFVSFGISFSENMNLVPGKPVTLRFFSPSICQNDNVIVNDVSTYVVNVELVRQQ